MYIGFLYSSIKALLYEAFPVSFSSDAIQYHLESWRVSDWILVIGISFRNLGTTVFF